MNRLSEKAPRTSGISASLYSPEFYQGIGPMARTSASEIVPILMALIKPKSVIDVGCGLGAWLSVFADHGVADICGVDGEYLEAASLEIPKDRFIGRDLRRPLDLGRRFDLVISLEVAEHLPADSADAFIDSLTRLGPVVLFSAAIPFQGGSGHLNEQWPDYWVRRFAARGYVPVDCIRNRTWTNDRVAWWYAQNALLYVERSHLEHDALLQRELKESPRFLPGAVHPRLHMSMAGMQIAAAPERVAAAIPLRVLLSLLPSMGARAVGRRIRRIRHILRRRPRT